MRIRASSVNGRRTRLCAVIAVGMILFSSPDLLCQVDPAIQRMVDSISLPLMQQRIAILERAGGHYSRVNFTPGNDSAAIILKQSFDAIPGLTSVVYDTFYIASAGPGLNTKAMVNIVATLQGKGDASRIFVAGAHFDCSGSRMGSSWTSQWQTMSVPGADDNATGLAIILELARIMSDPFFGYSPDATVKFIAFGAEESGPAYSGSHHGSKHFAGAALTSSANIIGMVSIDMVGYNPLHLYQSIITNASSTSLAIRFADAAGSYAFPLLTSTLNNSSATYSDHDSFWNDGYPAICLIENAPPWNSNSYYQANPFYHTSSDSSGTVNMELVRKVARMSLAAISTFAGEPVGVKDVALNVKPSGYRLEQNYPNPFNPTTVISFQLPVSSWVKLAVYDVLGRVVATLVDERVATGAHTVGFDGSRLVSGTYFCRLAAAPAGGGSGVFLQTMRMLLVK